MLSATVHDVLYYMSPIYCQAIIDSVLQFPKLCLKIAKLKLICDLVLEFLTSKTLVDIVTFIFHIVIIGNLVYLKMESDLYPFHFSGFKPAE